MAPASASATVTPTRIGKKYALVRMIGSGGTSDIWVAKNEATGAHVALKVLRPRMGGAIDAEERFRHEARLSALLTHRSIVRVFDLLEEPDGSLVLVMELLRGMTLADWLAQKGPLTPLEAMAVLGPVLSALDHGHARGIVHRDVKPSNVFLAVEPDGLVLPKLLDFGIAKMPGNDTVKTMDGVVLGTPSYMSPEQVRSEPDVDGRSDLFSCAVVLLESLTGECPFHAPTPAAAIAAVLQRTIDPDPRVDPRLWIEIARGLSKRPKERHASAAQMREAMLAAVGATEQALASVLRDAVPRSSGFSIAPPGGEMVSTGARTRSLPPVLPARRWAIVAAAFVLAASLLVAFLATRARSKPVRPAPIASAPAPSAWPLTLSAPPPPPPPSPSTTTPTPTATSTPASTPPPTDTRPPRSTPGHHGGKSSGPRPIATAPGF